MERKFKSGDLVRLVSDVEGQPTMTVDNYAMDVEGDVELAQYSLSEEQKKNVICVWRETNGKPHSEKYSEDSLVKC